MRGLHHRRSQGGHVPHEFLEYLVILCFESRYSKQNTAAGLKLKKFAPYATGLHILKI